MTKYIIVASSDEDIKKEADSSARDPNNYWYQSSILYLSRTKESIKALKDALENSSIDNMVFIAHGNSNEIGNSHPNIHYDFSPQQFADVLTNVIPEHYAEGDVYLSSCDESVANFGTKVCLSLKNTALNHLWVYGTNKAVEGSIDGPKSVVWQACRPEVEETYTTSLTSKQNIIQLSNDFTKILSTGEYDKNPSSCNSINEFISNYTDTMPTILAMYNVKSYLLNSLDKAAGSLNNSVSCILTNSNTTNTLSNDNDFRKKACEYVDRTSSKINKIVQTDLVSLFALQGKEIDLSYGQNILGWEKEAVLSFCSGVEAVYEL